MAVTDDGRVLRASLVAGPEEWDRIEAELGHYVDDGSIVGAAFLIAVRRRFRPGGDLREITRFVAAVRASAEGGEQMPPRECEAAIRAALGEHTLVDGIEPGRLVMLAHWLLTQLVESLGLSDEDIDVLVRDAEQLVDRWAAVRDGRADPASVEEWLTRRDG